MSIFKRRPEPELSDAALLAAAGADNADDADSVNDADSAAGAEDADSANEADSADSADDADPAAAGAGLAAGLPDPERELRAAAMEVARCWPQARGDAGRLLVRMTEISRRYGDESLWQRAPGGLMREAAAELYGLPAPAEAGALQAALRQAHDQGQREARERDRSKLGLAPARTSRPNPAALTPEERIRREISAARGGGLF